MTKDSAKIVRETLESLVEQSWDLIGKHDEIPRNLSAIDWEKLRYAVASADSMLRKIPYTLPLPENTRVRALSNGDEGKIVCALAYDFSNPPDRNKDGNRWVEYEVEFAGTTERLQVEEFEVIG